jgi:hypothetical protein
MSCCIHLDCFQRGANRSTHAMPMALALLTARPNGTFGSARDQLSILFGSETRFGIPSSKTFSNIQLQSPLGKSQPAFVRTILSAGGCFVVRRQHFARTPFKRALVLSLHISRPQWPLAPQWASFSQTGPTQGHWDSLKLGKCDLGLFSQCFFKEACDIDFPPKHCCVFLIPLLRNAKKNAITN